MAGDHDGATGFLPERPLAARLTVTLGMFALGPAGALALAAVLAPGAVALQAAGLFVPTLVMILGFKLWLAHAAVLLAGAGGGPLLRGLWAAVVRRESVAARDLLPDVDRLAAAAQKAAAACRWFRIMAVALAAPLAAVAALAAPGGSRLLAAAALGGWLVIYGVALTRLARAGYVALPEGP